MTLVFVQIFGVELGCLEDSASARSTCDDAPSAQRHSFNVFTLFRSPNLYIFYSDLLGRLPLQMCPHSYVITWYCMYYLSNVVNVFRRANIIYYNYINFNMKTLTLIVWQSMY